MTCLKSPAGRRTCPWRIANPTVYQMSLFCRTNRPSQPALAMRSFNGAENSVRNHYRPCYGLCLFTKWPSGLGGEKKKKAWHLPPPALHRTSRRLSLAASPWWRLIKTPGRQAAPTRRRSWSDEALRSRICIGLLQAWLFPNSVVVIPLRGADNSSWGKAESRIGKSNFLS